MRKDLTVGVYSRDAVVMRVPKDQIKIAGLKKDDAFPNKPRLCIINEEMVGVVSEYLEDESVFIVDVDERKIFAYNVVDTTNKPVKVGCHLYLKDDTITTEKANNTPLGYFMGMKGDTVLFKLV